MMRMSCWWSVLLALPCLLLAGCRTTPGQGTGSSSTGGGTPEGEYRQALQKAGLSAMASQLVGKARQSVVLTTKANAPAPGKTRIGGAPDLPSNVSWPMRGSEPLAFIAQVNLAEVAAHDTEKALPSQGMLYFFYGSPSETQPWGFDPKDRDNWKVVYVESVPASLQPTAIPAALPEECRYKAASVDFAGTMTFLPPDSYDLTHLPGMTDARCEKYWDAMIDLELSPSGHRLLGYPEIIQNDMQSECQLVTNGIYTGDGKYLEDPAAKARAEELEKASGDWRLLLQIASDEKCDIMWGDAGNIYFWIRAQDLKARDFSKVWVILQCG